MGDFALANEFEHKFRAENNERLLDKIENEFIDWKYIVLYYSALHFADAYLAKRHKIFNIKSHEERRKKYHSKLSESVFISYKLLENKSQIARYHPEMVNVLSEQDFKNLYEKDFTKIKSLI